MSEPGPASGGAVANFLYRPTEHSVSIDDGATLFDESAGGKDAIFGATYRALEERGYAGLSISRVADEASVSKSTIYHHFESKDDLLLEDADHRSSATPNRPSLSCPSARM